MYTINELPNDILNYLLCVIPSKSLLNLTNVNRRFRNMLGVSDSEVWKQKFFRIFLNTNANYMVGRSPILQRYIDRPIYDRRRACAYAEHIPDLKKDIIEIDSGLITLTGISNNAAVYGNRTGCVGLVYSCDTYNESNVYKIYEQPLVPNWITSVKTLKDNSVSVSSTAGMIHLCKISSTNLNVEAEWKTPYTVCVQLASELIWLGCMDGLIRAIDRRCPEVATSFTVHQRSPISCIDFISEDSNILVIGSSNRTLSVYDIRYTNNKLQDVSCLRTPIDIVSSPLGAILYSTYLQRCHMNSGYIDLIKDTPVRSDENIEYAKAVLHNGCIILLSKSGKLTFINPYTLNQITNHTLQLDGDTLSTQCYDINAVDNCVWISCGNHEITRIH